MKESNHYVDNWRAVRSSNEKPKDTDSYLKEVGIYNIYVNVKQDKKTANVVVAESNMRSEHFFSHSNINILQVFSVKYEESIRSRLMGIISRIEIPIDINKEQLNKLVEWKLRKHFK